MLRFEIDGLTGSRDGGIGFFIFFDVILAFQFPISGLLLLKFEMMVWLFHAEDASDMGDPVFYMLSPFPLELVS